MYVRLTTPKNRRNKLYPILSTYLLRTTQHVLGCFLRTTATTHRTSKYVCIVVAYHPLRHGHVLPRPGYMYDVVMGPAGANDAYPRVSPETKTNRSTILYPHDPSHARR